MSKIAFKDVNFRPDTLAVIEQANEIIESYQADGYRMTLRQLYYQFVSKNLIPNTEKSYKRLAGIISDGRLAGLVDWEAIEDRGRVVDVPSEWDSIQDIVNSAVRSFRLPRWADQTHYVELWVEKQALAGVLEPLAQRFHIPLMVNKGYSSQSAMFEASKRFRRAESKDKTSKLFYLGDHDPSGEDMVRDIGERLRLFGSSVEVTKLALTMAQVEEHNPPPNPAKMSDSRAANYVAQHGASSWEVDALPPNVLSDIITEAVEEVCDGSLMEEVIAKEERLKKRLTTVTEKIT